MNFSSLCDLRKRKDQSFLIGGIEDLSLLPQRSTLCCTLRCRLYSPRSSLMSTAVNFTTVCRLFDLCIYQELLLKVSTIGLEFDFKASSVYMEHQVSTSVEVGHAFHYFPFLFIYSE